jgi:hypothetical protein
MVPQIPDYNNFSEMNDESPMNHKNNNNPEGVACISKINKSLQKSKDHSGYSFCTGLCHLFPA